MSTLSTEEYINIVGEYNHNIHGSNIDPALYERGYSEHQLEVMKERATPRTVQSCNLLISRPLEEFSFSGFDYTYGLYNHFKDGILPFSGSTSDQPARIMEIFNLYKQLEYETEDKLRREQKANG